MKKVFFAVCVCSLLFSACLFESSKMTQTPKTVATVDGRVVTTASLDSTIKQIQKNSDPGIPADSLKTQAMDSLIAHELINIRRDSIKRELDNDWVFNRKRLDDLDQTVMKVLYDKEIVTRVSVDSAEVAKYFNDNSDKYMDPEQVKAAHILIRRPAPDTAEVKSKKQKDKLIKEADNFAKKRADAVLKKALAGENWDSLAAKYSEDKANAAKGGELGYFAHGRMMVEFDSASFKGAVGSIIGPIRTKYGYHIIKIEDHKMAAAKALDSSIEEDIRSDLLNTRQKDAANAFLDSLKQKATYVYNEDKLATPDSLVDSKTWIMIVDGTDTVFQTTVAETMPKYMRWKKLQTATVADKKDMLSILATGYILRHTARELGIMKDPEVVKAYDESSNIEANLRLSRLLNDVEYDPTEQEVTNYFQAHQLKYHEDRPLLVHHIIFHDSLLTDFQDSLLAEAVRDSILAGADFATMAKEHYPGEPEIREVAYNLDYIGPKDMGPEFYAVADTLKVGDISHPVKTSWGYHLIKLVNRKQDKTLDQVRPGIRQNLKDARNAEKTVKLVAGWRQKAVVVIDEKALSKFHPTEKNVIHIEAATAKKNGN